MDVTFCTAALEEALARHAKPEIFNTDQGSQPTHQPVVYSGADGRRHPDQHGWPRSLDGQCFSSSGYGGPLLPEHAPAAADLRMAA